MKRSILGIISIFCLQVGFVAYSTLSREMDAMVTVNETVSGTNPVVDLARVFKDHDLFFANADSQIDTEENVELSLTTTQHRVVERKPDRSLTSTFKKIRLRPGSVRTSEAAPSLRPVIIRIPPPVVAVQRVTKTKVRTEYPNQAPLAMVDDEHALSARSTERTKKKSFLSKTGSVIKKPYDWLKALGSKLN